MFLFSFSVETLPGDTEDSQQSERVSHLVMADVFVPVSEQTGDDSCKDRTMDVACKLHSKEACTVSLPERQYTPYKELTKVGLSCVWLRFSSRFTFLGLKQMFSYR